MLTMFDEEASRSRSHGLRPEILEAQARRLGLRHAIGRCTWPTYNEAFSRVLEELRADAITHVIFGDILFDEHRAWAERMCAPHGIIAVEPLFGLNTDDLFDEWVASGDRAVIVTARAESLDESWLGRPLNREMGPELKRLGVDLCGERGEYHTVVTDSGLFSSPLPLRHMSTVQRSGCWALDLALDDAAGR
jgi:diphthine-ammonia ligase